MTDTVATLIEQRRLGEPAALLRDRHASDVVDLLRQLGGPGRALSGTRAVGDRPAVSRAVT